MIRLIIALFFLFSPMSFAAIDANALFVPLSDAMGAVKKNDIDHAAVHLRQLNQYLATLDEIHSPAGKKVLEALDKALHNTQNETLSELAKALYTFEKEQNPIDYAAQRTKFSKRVLPVFAALKKAVVSRDIADVQARFKAFNSAWTLNEKAVRDTSLGHYGTIETAMSFLRIAMLSEPANISAMDTQTTILENALNDFIAGNNLTVERIEGAPETLADGIALLKSSHEKLQHGDVTMSSEQLSVFIRQWPIFEGDVRTRNATLYTQIESDLPIILANPQSEANQQRFSDLLVALDTLDVNAAYGIVDSVAILLREGTEALLIVMALLTALTATGQTQGKRWVYGGAVVGIIASIIGAIALSVLFPALTGGKNREMIEGVVGIIAVATMIFVGAWLHSKSSVQGWQRYLNQRLQSVVNSGNFIPLALLSFLAVFREGAETLLFYAAMLPKISFVDFVSGICIAVVLLVVIVAIIHFGSRLLPIHRLFAVMTWLIYLLGFKILGVSIHALQLTANISQNIVPLPAIASVGFYPSWEGMFAQLIYVALVYSATKWFNKT